MTADGPSNDGDPSQAPAHRADVGMNPTPLEVFLRVDIDNSQYHATLLEAKGQLLATSAVTNIQAALQALLDETPAHRTPAMLIDQPGFIAPTSRWWCQQRSLAVGDVQGLVICRPAGLIRVMPKPIRPRNLAQ